MVSHLEFKKWSMISADEDWELFCGLLRTASARCSRGFCIEFGTGAAGASMAIAHHYPENTVISIDTFEGLPPSGPEDEMTFEPGFMRNDFDAIRLRLDHHGFGRVRLHKAMVEEWVQRPHNDHIHVCCALVDVNLYSPTKAALDWLLKPGRVEQGGIIIIDDTPYKGVDQAITDACSDSVPRERLVQEKGRLAWIHII